MYTTMRYTLLLLCALLLCSACAPLVQEETSPPLSTPAGVTVPAAAASPTPAPTPDTLSEAESEESFRSIWRESLKIDVSSFLPETLFDENAPWQIFGAPQEERLWLPAMEKAVEEQLTAATEQAELAFCASDGMLAIRTMQTIEAPSWQLLYALLQSCENAQSANARIASAIQLDVKAEKTQEGLLLELAATPLPYREALLLSGGEDAAYLSRCFSYSYFSTVFDDEAAEAEYVLPAAEGCLSDGIVWPLASHTRLRKTWYADRDGGRRKHTGTDIWAKADTDIYSCTDGVIRYVGEGKGTGFAVIVTDAYGYEYHYYHMIRLSDFLHAGDSVKAGDLIGHVGNTGNSDLDHLHLTIVAPDGKYINPYPYLKAVEP